MSDADPYSAFLDAYTRDQPAAAPSTSDRPRPGEHRNLWVWVEHVDGEVYPASLENLGKARELADQLGAHCAAVVFGHGVRGVSERLGEYGADRVFVADDSRLENFRRGLYRDVLVGLVKEWRPEAVLFPATVMGRNLGAQLAAALSTGIVPNCVRLEVDASERRIRHFQTSFEDRLLMEVVIESRPQISTITPGSFRRPAPEKGRSCRIVNVPVPSSDAKPHVRFVKREPPQHASIETTDALVVGGLGVQSRESFRLVEELSQLVGGHVGATRAAISCGWTSSKNLVTSTRHRLRPRLYVACGVIGEFDHLRAIEDARLIVAITPDPTAPVAETADLIGVGDPTAVLTAMLKELRAARKERLLVGPAPKAGA